MAKYHLSIRDIQSLLRFSGEYDDAIDGVAGPLTNAAVRRTLTAALVPWSWSLPPTGRDRTMAAQIILANAGHEPGDIDGYVGPNTYEAFLAWQGAAFERPEVAVKQRWPHQSDVADYFGDPGRRLSRANIAYPMRIAWNTDQVVRSFACHEKVVEPIEHIFAETLRHYGTRVGDLGLDLFGGCYNYRRMRGGTKLSMHSWGIAVDLDPENNQLRWGRDRARFAREEYEPFWRIVESTGAVSLGRTRNFDWMHFQFART